MTRRKPRFFGRTVAQRGYDVRRRGQKLGRGRGKLSIGCLVAFGVASLLGVGLVGAISLL